MTALADVGAAAPASTRRVLDVHPAAWWVWAIALAVAASRTTSPLLLGLVIAVACLVVAVCRTAAPWALSFRLYLVIAAVVVVVRVLFRVVFGTGAGSGPTLVALPEIPLPDAVGLSLLGDVSAQAVLGGVYDGLRLAAVIVCVGAANALANPKRLLKAVPGALAELATAVVVTLSVFPQLAESVLRVTRARRLRGGGGSRVRVLHRVAVPVLEDALDRSLLLAAAMDSRGYGRTAAVPPHQRRLAATLVLSGLVGLGAGVYGVLDTRQDPLVGRLLLLLGGALAIVGMAVLGRVVTRTRYRPDRWTAQAALVAVSGLVVAVATVVAGRVAPVALNPPLEPLSWPAAPVWLLAAILVGTLPAWLAPGHREART